MSECVSVTGLIFESLFSKLHINSQNFQKSLKTTNQILGHDTYLRSNDEIFQKFVSVTDVSECISQCMNLKKNSIWYCYTMESWKKSNRRNHGQHDCSVLIRKINHDNTHLSLSKF